MGFIAWASTNPKGGKYGRPLALVAAAAHKEYLCREDFAEALDCLKLILSHDTNLRSIDPLITGEGGRYSMGYCIRHHMVFRIISTDIRSQVLLLGWRSSTCPPSTRSPPALAAPPAPWCCLPCFRIVPSYSARCLRRLTGTPWHLGRLPGT